MHQIIKGYLISLNFIWMRERIPRGERELGGKIYLFGEASIEALKNKITSPNPEDTEKAIDSSVVKMSMIRTAVDDKHVKKIFVEDGSVLARPIIFNFPDSNVEILHIDPRVLRTIRVTRQQIADSIALKEKLMSEFAAVREEPPKSEESPKGSVEQGRYAHVLEERMKGLTAAEELYRKLDETISKLEGSWIEQIQDGFVDPALVVCDKIHVCPSKEDIMAYGKSGRIPEVLTEKGYDVELLFLEPEETVNSGS